MRSRNGDLDGNDLASAEAVDGAGSGIAKLEATALPEVALGRVKVGLRRTDLGHGLDVAVGVRGHLVPDLGATCGLHGGAERTGLGRCESTVGRDTGDEKGGGSNLLVHLDGFNKNCRSKKGPVEKRLVMGVCFGSTERLGPGERLSGFWVKRMKLLQELARKKRMTGDPKKNGGLTTVRMRLKKEKEEPRAYKHQLRGLGRSCICSLTLMSPPLPPSA